MSVLLVTGPDKDGDLYAKPMEWGGEGVEPAVLIIPRAGDPALGAGDRILARLTLVKGESHHYEGRLIRRIGTNPKKIVGIFRKHAEGGRIQPIDKGADKEWAVPADYTGGAQDGELVEAELAGPKGRMGLPRARIVDRLGDPSAPKAVSLIAIHQHAIPDDFPDDVVAVKTCVTCRWSLLIRPMPAITTMLAMPRPTPIPPTKGVMSSGSPSRMLRPMLPRTPRWTARRASVATLPISLTALCRCCQMCCPVIYARFTKASIGHVLPCGWCWMPRATNWATISTVVSCAHLPACTTKRCRMRWTVDQMTAQSPC